MDLIKNKMNEYLLQLIEKENLTPEEYVILSMEYEKRKEKSMRDSEDTIMRIYRKLK
jgi:hypothetical protein